MYISWHGVTICDDDDDDDVKLNNNGRGGISVITPVIGLMRSDILADTIESRPDSKKELVERRRR